MTPQEQTFADYATSHLTTGPHLIHHFRADLAAQQVIPAGELSKLGEGAWVRVAGAIIVRQHPMTAKGFVFLTMEDETGMCQAIISPDLYRQNRTLIIESPCLIVEGPLQKGGGQMSVKAFRFRSFATPAAIPSHDFH